ncbi:DsbA family oxidoreductase [Lignipirellula cremea]|uniref:DSBA-like thioredoxin domain protein n=1 Tax=Lignipirellula cremea TaxID=2528010 RepID=A0A518DWD9_9BACT|nr:DsbA family oxidoreductase [Lignipirellula cremea]QDU96147.1 DSBA-like thioredoxin domain protein [Lignipirellula cremea]
MTLNIDVISDVICPWCYIGKRRMERAIALAGREDVRVRWRPFQLNPTMPIKGISRKEYRSNKFGSWERSLALDATVAEAGQAEGISFRFDNIEKTPNTLNAHRLIWLADQEGVQDAVVETLFRAYFTEGQDLTSNSCLLDLASQGGLDRRRTEAFLESSDGLAAVQDEEDQARRAGVQGVPLFIINDSVVLSGAREPSAFLEAFRSLNAESPPNALPEVCDARPDGEPNC